MQKEDMQSLKFWISHSLYKHADKDGASIARAIIQVKCESHLVIPESYTFRNHTCMLVCLLSGHYHLSNHCYLPLSNA